MRRFTLLLLTALVWFSPISPVRAASDPATAAPRLDDPLLRALEKELQRSFDGLRQVESASPLYYLGYEARDNWNYAISASMGAIQHERASRNRSLDVDVRVGTHQLDNTHQLKGRGGRFEFPARRYTEIPVDDDEAALRAAIWTRTDQVFKDALNRFTKVQTNKAVTAREEDPSDDFSVESDPAGLEAPTSFYQVARPPRIDRDAWQATLRTLSAEIKRYPFVYGSALSFGAQTENRYIVTSEGTRVVDGNTWIRIGFWLTTRTGDGMDLQRTMAYDANDLDGLPDLERMRRDLHQVAEELNALREGPLVEPYTGPAIFRNQATAVFFHEILGHRLEGHRQKLESEGQTFTKMLGKPVVAEFISVYDDPTIQAFEGQSLNGFYHYDDEGVAAQRVTLVANGVLEGFLMGRSPIRGFPRSNGHGRRGAGRFTVARMGTTIVETSDAVPYARLREMLIEEIERQGKPYGYVFHDISGGFTATGRSGPQSYKVIPHLVYRVYPDGRPDEAVRGVDIVGTPLTSFSKITAAADDDAVFNGSCGAESGWVPVSGIAPSVLVSEIEIEKKVKSSETPPILPPPHHDAAGDSP